MQIAKQQVASMLQKLPDDCSLEDYVIEKIKNGVARIKAEGVVSQQDAEKHLAKWIRENYITFYRWPTVIGQHFNHGLL